MGETLLDFAEWMLERLADSALDEKAQDVVLGALTGDDELESTLAGTARVEVDAAGPATPCATFLRSIAVQGFRGIGPEAKIALQPTPGLVVIAGRNGSGKSSLAEALEVVLTGKSYRWRGQPPALLASWRNLHAMDITSVTAELVEEGSGITRVGATWPEGTAFDQPSLYVQRDGQKREAGLDSLGWQQPLETYRPMLSYEELGALFDGKPSELHDALESILGLGQLNEAMQRLDRRFRDLRTTRDTAKKQRAVAKDAASAGTDERCTAARKLLSARDPDVKDVRSLLASSTPEDGGALAFLNAIVRLELPSADIAQRSISELQAAKAEVGTIAEQQVSDHETNVDLLQHALRLWQASGDQDCPVCGGGRLGTHWADHARAQLATQSENLAALREVRQRLTTARANVARLVVAVPTVLRQQVVPLTSFDAVATGWAELAAAPDGDEALIAHIGPALASLRVSFEALIAEAREQLQTRDDEWQRVVPAIVRWLDAAELAATDATKLRPVEAANDWLKKHSVELRNERLEPLADHARRIWSLLRQESNVDLGRIALESTSTRRRVNLNASVDGEDAGALSVMSQGELHALALALFIPRAASPASPFRFVVLDDPIQAMDPSKVDGFVKVLEELAKTHQVIVLSHDDRLPAAVRALNVDARILEVGRSPGSVVTVRSNRDPATRYLDDARALCLDRGVPDEAKRTAVPFLLRMAVESACHDHFFAAQLSAGTAHQDVEDVWSRTKRTTGRVALALFDDAQRSLDSWQNARPYRRHALGVVSSGAHTGLRGDARAAVDSVTNLVDDLR